MTSAWSERVAEELTDSTRCPRCGEKLVGGPTCRNCGAVLDDAAAARVWDASVAAAAAVRDRQMLVERMSLRAPGEPEPALAQVTSGAATAPVAVAPTSLASAAASPAVYSASGAADPLPAGSTPSSSESGSQVSLQSVLAVAGAGLLAIAAIVFTFFNPDLTDDTARTLIIGATTVVFLLGALGLQRTGLRLSAEVIAALAAVFLAIEIAAVAGLIDSDVDAWGPAAVATLAFSAALLALATWTRLRTWLWIALVGLAVWPAMLGQSVDLLGATNPAWWYLGAGYAAIGTAFVASRLRTRFGSELRAERVTATILQAASVGSVVIALLPATESALVAGALLAGAAVLSTLAAATVRTTQAWSFTAGALVTAAGVVAALSLTDEFEVGFVVVAVAATAVVLAITVLGGFPVLRMLDRRWLSIGLGSAAALAIAPLAAVAIAMYLGGWWLVGDENGLAWILGLAGAGAGWIVIGLLGRRVDAIGGAPSGLRRASVAIGLWLATASLTTLVSWPELAPELRVGIAVAAAVALGLGAAVLRRRRSWTWDWQAVPVVAGYLVLVTAAVTVWTDNRMLALGGAGVAVALLALTPALGRRLRAANVALAYGFALAVLGGSLSLTELPPIAALSLTTAAGALVALATTLVRRVTAPYWYAVLVVTSVPFLAGIVAVFAERSGWTALSTAVVFALAVTLVTTRRPGLDRQLRALAAAVLLPSLSVIVICLGAQVLAQSASPITLPVIAVLVAIAVASTDLVGALLARYGHAQPDIGVVRIAIELSALATTVAAVVLSLARDAAGLGTSVTVLLIVGAGSAVAALTSRRRWAWPATFVAWTGALWCGWALVGVDVLEPYVLPPALAAVLLGVVAAWRGHPGTALYSAGLTSAIVPTAVALAASGSGDTDLDWRPYGMLVGAAVLLLLVAAGGRASVVRRLAPLRIPTLLGALLAASGGSVEAVRSSLVATSSPMANAVAFSAASAVLAAAGALLLARMPDLSPRARQWLGAVPLLYLGAGPIAAVRTGDNSYAVAWSLMALLLVLMIVAADLVTRSRPVLPPVWFLFALAWAVGVAGWSARELRVEVFSLPLGLALIAAGAIALRADAGDTASAGSRSLASWPAGYTRSWHLLAPGIVVLFSASIASTATDPVTWRAILVIALALVTILIGAIRRLAAPFLLGILVLPIENVTVFAVQVGGPIDSTPWWITLATAGLLLLVIAVTSERRSTGEGGIAARMRDLR